MKPHEIESLSFRIIDREAGPHDFDREEWQVVRRMIHTSADFEYKNGVRFHKRPVSTGIHAIRQGKAIITDTNMARAGIRKKELSVHGASVQCLIDDPDVKRIAQKEGITRAKAAVDAALKKMSQGIYVVGNAPTALLRLIEHLDRGNANPALVIGLPVGFVNARESKDALRKRDIPYITNVGRKGGSNVAAAVVNALAIMASNED